MTARAFRQVVLTREANDNRLLARALDGLGVPLVDYPCIRTEALALADELVERLRAAHYPSAIFVSRNAVRTLLRQTFPVPERVVALGPGTARELEAHGWRATAMGSEPLAQVLAREIAPLVGPEGPILYARAQVGSTTVPDRLRALGREVDEVICYRTTDPVTAPAPLAPGRTLFVFASPSAIRHYTAHNPVPNDALALCIGPTTADEARKHGFSHVEETASSETDAFEGAIRTLCRMS